MSFTFRIEFGNASFTITTDRPLRVYDYDIRSVYSGCVVVEINTWPYRPTLTLISARGNEREGMGAGTVPNWTISEGAWRQTLPRDGLSNVAYT